MSKMYVGHNKDIGWFVYGYNKGRTKYLRDDMTTHPRMNGGGGTYFNTREEAQEAADRYNAMYWVVSTPDNRTLHDGVPIWRDLTPEEKGALLLAKHEGRTIQYYNKVHDFWADTSPTFHPMDILRVKPEPVRKTVKLYGVGYEWGEAQKPCDADTHKLTFNIVDGEIDCGSVKMEKL